MTSFDFTYEFTVDGRAVAEAEGRCVVSPDAIEAVYFYALGTKGKKTVFVPHHLLEDVIGDIETRYSDQLAEAFEDAALDRLAYNREVARDLKRGY